MSQSNSGTNFYAKIFYRKFLRQNLFFTFYPRKIFSGIKKFWRKNNVLSQIHYNALVVPNLKNPGAGAKKSRLPDNSDWYHPVARKKSFTYGTINLLQSGTRRTKYHKMLGQF